MYTLDFQVWRPAPNVSSTGCYSLVGNNRFTQVQLSGGVTEPLSPALPEDRIQVQPGDVLGLYVETTRDNPEGRGIVLLRDGEYETEEVWYADFSNPVFRNGLCMLAVGPSRTLSSSINAAPVISLAISKSACIH